MVKKLAGFTCNITRSNRRTVRLTVGRGGRISIYAPKKTSLKELNAFVLSHADFVRQAVEKHINTHDSGLFGECAEAPVLFFLGTAYPVIFDSNTDKPVFDGSIFSFPDRLSAQAYREMIVELYRKLAKEIIPPRVAELSSLHGLPFKSISINRAVTRWGSCSSKKTLNFSLFLVTAPLRCIDQVIKHELAHTVYMNHGADFYKLLQSLEPDHKALRSELSRNFGKYPKKF